MATVKICPNCGHMGYTKTLTKGSIFIELILWLCFVVPGLIYSIWRLTTRHAVCARCGSPLIIPLDTPRGQALVKEIGEAGRQSV